MNFDCPVDTSSSKTARQHAARATQNWLQTNCPDFIAKKISGLQIHPTWTPWITMSGGNVGGLSQAPSETENDRRTELQVIWTAYLRDQ